jgi:hypothetical protein
VLTSVGDDPSFHGVLMNVISMMHKINVVANPMIGKPALPNLALSTNNSAEAMRIRTLDESERLAQWLHRSPGSAADARVRA